jgi:hypothetical protein
VTPRKNQEFALRFHARSLRSDGRRKGGLLLMVQWN